jgi:curved DNA-binding protein CbpA
MVVKDYYKVLGVERTASAKDIKIAYYKLIKKYHPDLYPNNPVNHEKFREIVEAFRVLGNLDNRLQYSILLNQDVINRELLHKRIKIPGLNKDRLKVYRNVNIIK